MPCVTGRARLGTTNRDPVKLFHSSKDDETNPGSKRSHFPNPRRYPGNLTPDMKNTTDQTTGVQEIMWNWSNVLPVSPLLPVEFGWNAWRHLAR